MKKFGTPIGAGPGRESENVGFEVFGTPLPVGSLAFGDVVVVVFFFALRFGFGLVDGGWPWVEDCWGDEDVGCGVVLDEVEVVVLVVLECEGEVEVGPEVVVDEDDALDEEEEEEEEELDELGDVVVVVVVVVVDEDDEVVGVTQVIVSIAPGIPAPPTVTVTLQESAEAIGMAARPRTTKIAAASSSTARSLRLNVKLVRPLLPPSTCASHASESAAHRRAEGTLLTGPEVCNLEPDGSRRGHSPPRARPRARPRVWKRSTRRAQSRRTGRHHTLKGPF